MEGAALAGAGQRDRPRKGGKRTKASKAQELFEEEVKRLVKLIDVKLSLKSLFRGLLRGVLLARPKVTTQGSRRVARSAAGLVRANPPTGHHLPSRPSPSAICDLPPAGCCSASHQLAHLRIP